jgi:hypothetical protein
MVLLTMTASIVDGLAKLDDSLDDENAKKDVVADGNVNQHQTADSEPSLAEPAIGKPISHGQIVDIWQTLQVCHKGRYSLEELLRGSQVYIPPPPPKPEPVSASSKTNLRMQKLLMYVYNRPKSTKPSWHGYGTKKLSERTNAW